MNGDGAPRGLRAGGIVDRPLRRQLELARPDLVPGQLPADRVAAEVPSLLRRRLHGRVPDRLGTDDDALARWPPSSRAGCRASSCGTTTAGGRCSAAIERFQHDPHWRDLFLFHEYFHGDNGAAVGASHQTGWTGLVAKLLKQSGEPATTSTRRHHRPIDERPLRVGPDRLRPFTLGPGQCVRSRRSSAASDHAWKGQPPAAYGASPLITSGRWPARGREIGSQRVTIAVTVAAHGHGSRPQACVAKGVEQPWPGRALMVGTVPCLDPASIVAHISRFAGGERSQAKWHEQFAFDGVDDPLRHDRPARASAAGRQRQRSDSDAMTYRCARNVVNVNHVVETSSILIPESSGERCGRSLLHWLPPCVTDAGDSQGIDPEALDLHRFADPWRDDTVGQFARPSTSPAGRARRRQSVHRHPFECRGACRRHSLRRSS